MKLFLHLSLLLIVPTLNGSVLGLNENELIKKLGRPRSFIEVGHKKIVSYSDRTIILKNAHVVVDRPIEDSNEQIAMDVVVWDTEGVVGQEPLGLVAESDAFVRGGRFDRIPQERLGVPFLSVSGSLNHFTIETDEDNQKKPLGNIRKVYLKFQLDHQDHETAILVLHTAKTWDFDGAVESPFVHVYGVKSSARESEGVDWTENELTWVNAVGNSQTHGADLDSTKRLLTTSFAENCESGIQSQSELRFDLGSLSNVIQEDGSVTLVIAQSSSERLDFISKDSNQDDRMKPRLLLK